MRGLTPAEYACLAEAADDLPAREVPEDDCRHEQAMVAQGRIETITYYEGSRRVIEYKALSLHDRYIYLWQCRGRHDRQEEDQPRWERQAEQARLDADAAERWAVKQREEWEASRAYFATLEAAGLWPVAAPGGADKEQP